MTDTGGAATGAAAAATLVLYCLCSAVYLLLTALVLLRLTRGDRISRSAALLALGAATTAAWAVACAWQATPPLAGAAAAIDLLRGLTWYGFVLHLYRKTLVTYPAREPAEPARTGPSRLFSLIGGAALLATTAAVLSGHAGAAGPVSLASPGVALRLALAVCQLLLLENLYRNTQQDMRWNLNLACIGLGGMAAFDLVLCADAALFHRASAALVGGRAVAALLVCPLLALAAARNRAWSVDIHVSRSAVFHSATLVVSGVFLLAVAASGAVLRQLGIGVNDAWGGVLQVGMLFAGVLVLAVLLTSGTARSQLRSLLVDHFFSNRYDYRREWLRCIDTLSDDRAHGALHSRVIRAVAQVVDSPAGMLLLHEPDSLGLRWAESWNLPPLAQPLPPDHTLLAALQPGGDAVALAALGAADPLAGLWLAVPLYHAGGLAGCVVVAPPRAPFRLDREVFALLRAVAREVATYLAEQRATRVLLETRELRAYGERFAFVAHDIKNVSSQLSLLLSNAETHLANPDFQRDMLLTVGASVRKIGALIQRLQAPEPGAAPPETPVQDAPQAAAGARPGPSPVPLLAPVERLAVLARRMQQLRGTTVVLEPEDAATADLLVAMDPSVFDTVVTHLLDNAIEAGGAAQTVRLPVRHEAGRLLVDIVDTGPGMTPEFVRDQLFRPFRTSKREGSGIGAYQARALLRAAAGDLLVLSRPGQGTTMRLLLPLREAAPAECQRAAAALSA